MKTILSFAAVALVAITTGIASVSSAALPPKPLTVQPGHWTSPIQTGAITGGFSADPLSLVDIKAERSVRSEKLVISYGDMQGKPMRGEPGFFHVTVDRAGRRVVIDLSDVTRTAIDPADFQKRFKGSAIVAKTDMTMDPNDGSTNLTLLTKVPVTVSV